jgi:hypothetical protein
MGVVGAVHRPVAVVEMKGAVYLHEKTTGQWVQLENV